MQPPKKGTKYSKRTQGVEDTLPPGAFNHLKSKEAPSASVEDEKLMLHSLTPVNVLEKIRNDIVAVLGIQRGISGKFSDLESMLVDHLEKIVRKGQCPSILVKKRHLIEGMLCLKKYFENESVVIRPDDHSTRETISVPVFPALYKYAKDAAFCEQRIRELRHQRGVSLEEKKKIDAEIKHLKERKDNCLIYYQKILFTDAEALSASGRQRVLAIHGKRVTLDDLLQFVKKGGRLDQARIDSQAKQNAVKKPVSNEASLSLDETPDETLGSFDQTNTFEDVVDWRQIRSDT